MGKRKRKRQARRPANVTLLPLCASRLRSECVSHGSYRSSLQAKCLQQDEASLQPEEASPSGSIRMPDSEQAFHSDYVSLQTHDNLRGGYDCPHPCFTEAEAQRGAGTLAKVLCLLRRGQASALSGQGKLNFSWTAVGKCQYAFAQREPAKGIHQPPLSLGFHGDQAWLGDSTVAYVVSGISRFLGHMPQ